MVILTTKHVLYVHKEISASIGTKSNCNAKEKIQYLHSCTSWQLVFNTQWFPQAYGTAQDVLQLWKAKDKMMEPWKSFGGQWPILHMYDHSYCFCTTSTELRANISIWNGSCLLSEQVIGCFVQKISQKQHGQL